MHWDYWIRCAADRVLARPGSSTAGVDGKTRDYFKKHYEEQVIAIVSSLMSILKRRIADKEILELIWKFLKTGIMEGELFARTEAGVPQGGVISPLLANIYLNEFDKWAEEKWKLTSYERAKRRAAGKGNYKMVRYADDEVSSSSLS